MRHLTLIPQVTRCEFFLQFSRGNRVKIISGRHLSVNGTVDFLVFQQSVDYHNEHTLSYHLLLDDNELVVTIGVKRVESLN